MPSTRRRRRVGRRGGPRCRPRPPRRHGAGARRGWASDGVQFRPHGATADLTFSAPVVIGADGSQSLVRRSLGIEIDQHPYNHEQVIIGGEGPTELPAALHWYLDDLGALTVVSRPRQDLPNPVDLQLGQRGDLLRRPDPALHDFVVERFQGLKPLRFAKADAHLYRLRPTPGRALLGAQRSHHRRRRPRRPSGHDRHEPGHRRRLARLSDRLGPLLLAAAPPSDLDAALEAYEAERRPAAALAVESNHKQAMRIWQSDLFKDPDTSTPTPSTPPVAGAARQGLRARTRRLWPHPVARSRPGRLT